MNSSMKGNISIIRILLKLTPEKLKIKIPDEIYLKLLYKVRMGKRLNLDSPKTFNEKLQWLKLNDRKQIYTKMVDKYEAKKYVAEHIGEEYVIPTLGVWEQFDDIDFNVLPNQFVLKCTHDSGGLVICRNKDKLDKVEAKEKIEKSLKNNYYYHAREWPYRNVEPRIIAEEYMDDCKDSQLNKVEKNLNVYKVFNFSGVPKIIQTIQNDKQPTETIDYFDINWEVLDMKQNYPNSNRTLNKPEKLDEMLQLASKLSKGFPFLRTDFYIVNDKIYFSEFTFYSDAGFAAFHPECWDMKLGEWLKLPNIS